MKLNRHEFAKCQLSKAGMAYEALDNGLLRCADPAALQGMPDGLTAEKIDAVVRKWFARLPQPFTAADRAPGFRYEPRFCKPNSPAPRSSTDP